MDWEAGEIGVARVRTVELQGEKTPEPNAELAKASFELRLPVGRSTSQAVSERPS